MRVLNSRSIHHEVLIEKRANQRTDPVFLTFLSLTRAETSFELLSPDLPSHPANGLRHTSSKACLYTPEFQPEQPQTQIHQFSSLMKGCSRAETSGCMTQILYWYIPQPEA